MASSYHTFHNQTQVYNITFKALHMINCCSQTRKASIQRIVQLFVEQIYCRILEICWSWNCQDWWLMESTLTWWTVCWSGLEPGEATGTWSRSVWRCSGCCGCRWGCSCSWRWCWHDLEEPNTPNLSGDEHNWSWLFHEGVEWRRTGQTDRYLTRNWRLSRSTWIDIDLCCL